MIQTITEPDFAAFWPDFQAIVQARESYALAPDIDYRSAYDYWCVKPAQAFVYLENGKPLASYYIKANAMGPGDHICNCGYMVAPSARGRGLARKLCEHSQQVAAALGFKAMQFNSVVASNNVAVALWQNLGFAIIGTIPDGYRHPELGYVDCYIMYKALSGRV